LEPDSVLGTPSLTPKHKTRLERLARGKHSSLLQTFINYGREKCYNIDPWSLLFSTTPPLPPPTPSPPLRIVVLFLTLVLAPQPRNHQHLGQIALSLSFVSGLYYKTTKRCKSVSFTASLQLPPGQAPALLDLLVVANGVKLPSLLRGGRMFYATGSPVDHF
jgi:hypothetical protein